MYINHNIAALNAWRNLGISNSDLAGSLEKLSSGYRINRGADDPAGLLISEKLRAQVNSLDQAIRNASDAISMVQTAEGALTEMNNMLNSIRILAVHAANTGANDVNSIAADQTAVDKAVSSMQRIATTTKFAGKSLLDGTAGTAIENKQTSIIQGISVGTVGASGDVALDITNDANLASLTLASFNGASQQGSITLWVENNGTATSPYTYVSGSTETLASLAGRINADSTETGIQASYDAVGIGGLVLQSTEYGDHVEVHYVFDAKFDNAVASAGEIAGSDIVATVAGSTLQGSGLYAYGSSGNTTWVGTSFQVFASQNTVQTVNNAASINVGQLTFSLTDDASQADLVYYSINNMQTSIIGNTADVQGTNSLNDIMSGGTQALGTDAAGAVAIIDASIAQVSTERANLGAFQKFTLETTITNLGVTKENLAASESRIRDVDMASEMMEFTKNQILVQAGTAMLAQANQLPQTVLQLLQG